MTRSLKAITGTIILSLSLASCAHTHTNKEKVFRNMLVGFVAGSIIGAATAPDGEKKEAHALLWGSSVASASAVYSTEKYDDSEELNRLRLKVKSAEIALSKSNDNSSATKSFALPESVDLKSVPKEIRENIKPTILKVKKVDEWRLGSKPNSHLHCDTEVEFEGSKIVK